MVYVGRIKEQKPSRII